MSASKKDELLKNLTRRSEQKPPMDVTYEHKEAVLDQITDRSTINENSIIASNNDSDSEINIDSNNDVGGNFENNIASNSDKDNKNNNKVDIDDDNANDISTDDELGSSSGDALDSLLFGKKAVSNKIYKGFYLEPEIVRVLDKLAKKQGKGIQSQLVNESLRKIFKEKGLMNT